MSSPGAPSIMTETTLYDVQSIRQTWRLDDPKVYRWAFQDAEAGIHNFFYCLVGFLISPPLFYLPFWLLSYLSTGLAWWTCAVLTAFVFVIHVCYGWFWLPWSKDHTQAEYVQMRPWMNIALMYLLLILLALPESPLTSGFRNADDAGPFTWLLFFWDNMLSVVLVGLPDVLSLRLSSLAPDDASSRGLTALLRVFFGAGVLELAKIIYQLNWASHDFVGTVRDSYWKTKALPNLNPITVVRVGAVESLTNGCGFRCDHLRVAFPDPEQMHLNVAAMVHREGLVLAGEQPAPPPTGMLNTPDEVRKGLDFHDPTTYRWEVSEAARNRGLSATALQLVSLIVAGPIVCYVVFWLLSLIHHGLALWTCRLALLILVLGYSYDAFVAPWSRNQNRRLRASKMRPVIGIALVWLLVVLPALPGSTTGAGFTGAEGAGLWSWIVFLLDNTLDPLLLGIPDVLGLHLTSIAPADFWSRALTAALRLFIGAGVVEFVLLTYRLNRERQEFYGTVLECYWHCRGLPGSSTLTVVQTSKVTPLTQVEAAEDKDFLRAYKAETAN